MATITPLPIPPFYNPREMEVSSDIDYLQLDSDAISWRRRFNIKPAGSDGFKIALLAIDVQGTFCFPSGELFVSGQSGHAAIDDNHRLAQFVYHYLHLITGIYPTMDTHNLHQIFSPLYWVDQAGNHPAPFTQITVKDVVSGTWKPNPALANILAEGNPVWLQNHALHYVKRLEERGKYTLIIWPPHARLGGRNHALVPGLERAFNVHGVARATDVFYEVKGGNPFTENYSAINPEVMDSHIPGHFIAQKNTRFFEILTRNDMLIIAGQAASHCVAWTIDDLLTEIYAKDRNLAKNVYILRDCTSSIVIPNVHDYTPETNEAFRKFESKGMHLVESTTPIEKWPGVRF